MEILAINPRRKKPGKRRKTAGTGAAQMASKKRRGSSGRAKARSRKRVVRNPGAEMVLVNPAPKQSLARRGASRARGFLASSGIGGAVKSMMPMLAGALGAKLAQKKFGDKTEETGNWTWKDYLTGALGALVVSQGSKWIFKASPATAQKILEGGLLTLLFKMVTQELVPMSETAVKYLGAAEDDEGSWDGIGEDDEGSWDDQQGGYGLGDLYEAPDGETYVFDGTGWTPWDSSARASDDGYNGELIRPTSQLGGMLTPPTRQLGGDPYAEKFGTNW